MLFLYIQVCKADGRSDSNIARAAPSGRRGQSGSDGTRGVGKLDALQDPVINCLLDLVAIATGKDKERATIAPAKAVDAQIGTGDQT